MKPFVLLLLLSIARFASNAAEDDFVPLFNGRDLHGWINVNCAPETWSVRDGVIHCTGKPTGALRTPRQYENFIFEVEWRHLTSGGNAGIFIWGTPIAAPGVPFLRAIEVQVLDNGYDAKGKNEWYTTHGDVFPIHGATMKPFGRHNGQRSFPSEERSKSSPEWNRFRIVCTNGVLRHHVNGKEVSGGEDCNYRKGYLALESEGAPVEFRNLRIKELPPSGAAPDVTAPLDAGWNSLFTGLDFRGWHTNAAVLERWAVQGERIVAKTGSEDVALRTEREFGNAEFIVDYRPAQESAGAAAIVEIRGAAIPLKEAEPGKYQRYTITVNGKSARLARNDKEIEAIDLPANAPKQSPFALRPSGVSAELMNFYVRELN